MQDETIESLQQSTKVEINISQIAWSTSIRLSFDMLM